MQFVDEAVDLFCGAGGLSTGILNAYKKRGRRVRLTAVNHWKTAINTHSLNHPNVIHVCEPVENLHPRKHARHLRILAVAAECIYHSIARGGGPCNEQSRSQPWQVIRWASDIDVESILMENVKEFVDWGPLLTRGLRWKGKYYRKDRPDPRFKGTYFNAFVQALRNLGYTVEWRIQCAANFGDATSRQRFILMARKGLPIHWPKPTHGPGTPRPWKPAADIIDWSIEGTNIFERKALGLPPLCENTIERIIAGLEKFGGPNAQPFIACLRGTTRHHIQGCVTPAGQPLPTITANGNHMMLVEPFVTQYHGNHKGKRDSHSRNYSLSRPLPNQETSNRYALVEPFVAPLTHRGNHRGRCKSARIPLASVTGAHRGELALIEPMLIGQQTPAAARPTSQPAPTVAAKGAIQLVEPIVVQFDQKGSNGHCSQPVRRPLKTLVTKQNMLLVEPILVKYYGSGVCKSTRQPLDTITSRDRFLLVECKTGRAIGELQLRTRMLQPHELGAAHSFPSRYIFTGTKEDQTKQIGNSVPIRMAEAHAAMLIP